MVTAYIPRSLANRANLIDLGASGNAALPARVVFDDRATPRTASCGYSTPKNRLAPGDAARMAVRIIERHVELASQARRRPAVASMADRAIGADGIFPPLGG